MNSKMKKLFVTCLMAVFMFAAMGMTKTDVDASSITGRVASSRLTIHADKSSSSKKLGKLKEGKKVRVLESGSKWVKISVGGVVGYVKGKHVKTAHGTASNLYSDAISGKATKKIAVRTSKNSDAKHVAIIQKGQKVKVLTTNSTWVKVKVGDVVGYTKGKYLKTEKGTASQNSSKGELLVTYAKRFLGNPYRWGGESLTHGADCSGFVKALYRHFGRSLPHSSYALRRVGRAVRGGVKNAKPGDIICYSGHVAIYMGGNRVIHASNPKSGIKITNNASYRHIVAIRRIF